jgi:NAD(P)-dependent dehydrogenase (short-subunit alcohol dehydrogenase family)
MDQEISLPNGCELTGRRFLLTGASGSIGRAAAVKLAAAGARLVLTGRDAVKLKQVVEGLTANEHIAAPFDLADSDGIVGWMRDLAEKGGTFSGLVHTAATQTTRPLRAMSAEFVMTTLHMNVTVPIMLGKGFRQKVCHTDPAAMVLMSSTAAFIGGAGNVPYAASKGGVMAASKGMAHELLRENIRVNCVVSGLVEGEMAERARALTPPESWKNVLSGYPMGLGKAEDIASAILYLVSDRSRWMTGTDLQIDGGLSIL